MLYDVNFLQSKGNVNSSTYIYLDIIMIVGEDFGASLSFVRTTQVFVLNRSKAWVLFSHNLLFF